ncbi:MAG: exodeoxyribonuclease VII small subunit [Ruminococcaceae bacterium]|nr:exodeoxyribonuclease VII small subunit [Oscillospiraceae bacterium]
MNNINDVTFEEAMARLEEIVKYLESGNAPLDKSLEVFEEGVALVKLCNSKLDNAEQKVRFLTSGGEEISDGAVPESGVQGI